MAARPGRSSPPQRPGKLRYLLGRRSHQFGMVHPRATDTARETLVTMKPPTTSLLHPRSRGAWSASKSPSRFLARSSLVHLAWRVDRSSGPMTTRLCVSAVERRLRSSTRVAAPVNGWPIAVRAAIRSWGSSQTLSPVRRHRGKDFEVYDGTCERLPTAVRDRSFDVDHLPARAAPHDRSRALAPKSRPPELVTGGRLICEVPNQQCAAAHWSGIAGALSMFPRAQLIHGKV